MASWVWPVGDHAINAEFGAPGGQWSSGNHTGVDFTASGGDPVQSVSGGRVVLARTASYGSPYGNYVIVDHGNGIYSLYAHLSGFNVRVGQKLKAGQHIGQVGSTGNSSGAHLHFEIRKGDDWMYPESAVNPMGFMSNRTDGGGGGMASKGNGGGKGNKDNGPSQADFGFSEQFLETHPEIRKLVRDAVQKEWSITQFQARVKDTKWWRTHTEAQRDWAILASESPAEAKDTIAQARRALATMAKQMGVDLGDKELEKMAEQAARNAWDTSEMQFKVGQQFTVSKGPETGQGASTVNDIRMMADEYGLPVSRQRLTKWTRNILQGEQTIEGYQDVMREQAKSLYPHLANILDTSTVRQWADPYLQLAGQMLGRNPEEMELHKGPYAKLLEPTKADKPMSYAQWQTMVRTDEVFGWDKSAEGQEQAADLVTQMARVMGAM